MNKITLRPSLVLAATFAAALTQGCAGSAAESDDQEESTAQAEQAVTYGGTLKLVRESKLSSLYGVSSSYQASGVQVLGSELYVIFDNKNQVGKMPTTLFEGTATYTPGTLSSSTDQYEGITFDSYNTQHFYLVQEVSPAMVVQLDGTGSAQGESYQSTGFNFSDANKGFEGIAWLRRNNNDYLLALCEAGGCGSTTGTSVPGTIKVLAQSGSSWSVAATISICADASCTSGPMSDYSDIALRQNADGSFKVAITSQESKKLWMGTLSATAWSLSGGTLYDAPSADYCNLEGVTFLSDTRLAMVSDQDKTGSASCNNEDESVHIFDLP
jgi:uncharacterized protein YjiK